MERVVNVRFVTGAALSLALGAALACATDNIVLRIIIPIVTFAVGIFLCFAAKRTEDNRIIRLIEICLLFIAIGFSVMTADLFNRGSFTGEGEINGRVCEVESRSYLLDEVAIDGVDMPGKMRINTDRDLLIGDKVNFSGIVATYEVDLFDVNSASRYNDRIYYYVGEVNNLAVTSNKLKLFERIAKRITDPLFKFMDGEDAGVAKSLLFGDKSDMTESDNDLFRSTGISHVFAVSGMHVGFLSAIVVFALKKVKVKPTLRLAITSVFILLYGFLTGFPSGIKRAFIMAFICMLAPLVRRKNDVVTSLCLACLVIIITNPRELFDVGFLMSALSVGGIILFARPIQRVGERLFKSRFIRKIIAGASLTIGASAMLLPIYTDVFGSVAIYAVIANIVIIPIVTFTYALLAVVALLCIISPAFGVLYYPLQYPITAIRLISTGISLLPYSVIKVGALGIVSVIYLVTLLFVSPINKLRTLPKISFAAISCVASTFILIFA